MNRFTEKVKNTDDYIRLATKDKQAFINKLGILEDLAEEIGCPLEIVITPYFKRGKLEVFYRGKMREVIRVVAFEEATRPYMDVFYRDNEKEMFKVKTIWLEDYKKTWWLKEDKSE